MNSWEFLALAIIEIYSNEYWFCIGEAFGIHPWIKACHPSEVDVNDLKVMVVRVDPTGLFLGLQSMHNPWQR